MDSPINASATPQNQPPAPVEPIGAQPIPVESEPVREPLWPALGYPRQLAAVGALFLIVIACFANSYKAGMSLDNKYIIDEYYKSLSKNNANYDARTWEQAKLFFQNDYWWPKGISGLYRPITSFSYWVNFAWLTGKAPKYDIKGGPVKLPDGTPLPDDAWSRMSWHEYAWAPGQLPTGSYHTVNLLLHLTTAILIYFVALGLVKKFWPALFTAALFASHPITTESVTNIIGRADIFAAISTIGGLLLYMRSLASRGWWRAPWLAGLALICLFGFFSKESAIAVGIIVPFYWFIFHFNPKQPDWWKPLLRELGVWCVMLPPLFAMVGVRYWLFANNNPAEEPFLDNPIRGIWQVQSLNLPAFEAELKRLADQGTPLLGVSYLECKMTAVKVMGKLLWLLAWPQTLCCDYSYSQIPNFSFTFGNGFEDVKAIIALVVLLGAIGLAVWLYILGYRAACFFIGFFFLAALPTSNFIVTIGSIMAERFMYLPLMGFTGIVAMSVFALGSWIWSTFKLNDRPEVPGYTILAAELLGLVVVVYGIRTVLRNPVWQDDDTLWTDAIGTSPNSFRSYQSLAFARWEKYPERGFDDLINLDERALFITERLPHHLNSSRLYLHLGMYHQLKGDQLCVRDSNGAMVPTQQAAQHYVRAIEVLEKGSVVDRSFNEVNYAKQLRRGDPPELIADVGLPTVYNTLAICYARLRAYDQAFLKMQYERQLDPFDVQVYFRIALLQTEQGKLDDAAVTLVQCILLDGNKPEFWQALANIYESFGDAGRNSIVVENGRPKLNPTNPQLKVYEHLQLAYRDLIRIMRRVRRHSLAESFRNTAVNVYGMPAPLMDEVLREPIPTVTPWGIRYDVVQPSPTTITR